MSHFLRSLNSLNRYMPNFNGLTLASHNEFRRSPTISPLQHVSIDTPRLALHPIFDDNDDNFQSNAQLSLSAPDSFSAGLGISYPQIPGTLEKAASYDTDKLLPSSNPSSFPPRKTIKHEPDDPTLGLHVELSCFYDPRIALSPSWSPSLSLVPGDVPAATDGYDSKLLHADFTKDKTSDTLSSLASASGMSIDNLAGKLSATADFALELMSSNSNGTLASCPSRPTETSLLEELYDVPELPWLPFRVSPMSDHPGLQASSIDPLLGTDPSEIMSKHLPSHGHLVPLLPESCLATPFYENGNSPMEDVLEDLSAAEDIVEEDVPYFQGLVSELNFNYNYDSDYNPELSDSDHEDNRSNSSYPSPRRKTRGWKFPTRSTHTANSVTPKSRQRIEIITEALDPPIPEQIQEAVVGIDFGTPVLDAHRGINLNDLISRAERYRIRNPGCAYDKTWLASFAGKLTERGELMCDYRCYVSGCTQTNKRRDHILIHMGSHLDHRPFPCSYCPARFLRKNECKRHEASHSGVKPFLCETCDSAFVRQDLLKRHTARAHGIRPTQVKPTQNRKRNRKSDIVEEENKENIGPRRPSKRVKQESNR